MNLFQSIILSIVEGITEFLPVSSTGHLILVVNFLKIPQTEFVKSFEIIIQLGAILAVVSLYFKRFLSDFRLWKNIIISFIPSAVFGLIFYKIIKTNLIGNQMVVVWSLLIGGVAMIIFEKFYKFKDRKLSPKSYLLIGLFQVLSMIPGVSRAFATIFGGMVVGMDRKKATEFSFFLAVPTMLGAAILDLVKTDLTLWTNSDILILTIGFIGSFLAALAAVKFLVRFVQTNDFLVFGVYRIIIALLLLV